MVDIEQIPCSLLYRLGAVFDRQAPLLAALDLLLVEPGRGIVRAGRHRLVSRVLFD